MIGNCDGSPTSRSGCSRTSSDPRPRAEGVAPSLIGRPGTPALLLRSAGAEPGGAVLIRSDGLGASDGATRLALVYRTHRCRPWSAVGVHGPGAGAPGR